MLLCFMINKGSLAYNLTAKFAFSGKSFMNNKNNRVGPVWSPGEHHMWLRAYRSRFHLQPNPTFD